MTFWTIWWRVLVGTIVVGASGALLVTVCIAMPAWAWPIIGYIALGLVFVTWLSVIIWIDKGARK